MERFTSPVCVCLVLVLSSLLSLSACKDKHSTQRRYEEVITTAPNPAPRDTGVNPSLDVSGLPRSEYTWTTPETWEALSGSGMRLAAFRVGEGNEQSECTIIVFPGMAGGVEANIRRWMGQLNLSLSSEEVGLFLAGALSFTTEGSFNGTFFDFGQALSGSEPQQDSMLSSIINVNEATMFIKMQGPKALLTKEKERFLSLSRSIK